jgi:hypothetical protein
LSALVAISGYFVVNSDPARNHEDKENRTVDWIGAFMISSGLLLFTFSLADGEGAYNGWATPYIPVLLIVGLALIVGFWFWERHLEFSAANSTIPLMKTSLWHKGKFTIMQLIATFAWSAFASFLFFATQ